MSVSTKVKAIAAICAASALLPVAGVATRIATAAPAPIQAVKLQPTAITPEAARVFNSLNGRYRFGERSAAVRRLQVVLGVTADGWYYHQTRAAHLGVLGYFGMNASHVPAAALAPSGTAPANGSKRCPQFVDLARQVGWPETTLDKISYIMWRESRCNPGVHNPRGRDDSYGLMQLNMRAHRSWVLPLVGGDVTRLWDPETNLRIALDLYHRAGGFGPWQV